MLSRAVLLCLARRARAAARANPALGAAAVGALAVTPILLARAGARVGEALAPVVAAGGEEAVAVPLALAAAAAGAAVALGAPGCGSLCAQVVAAPARRRTLAAAASVVPALAAAVPATLLALAFAIPLAGGAAGLAVVAGLAVACALAAAAVELAIGSRRRGPVGIALGGVLALSWPLCGAVAGDARAGPVAVVARGVAGGADVAAVAAALAALAVGLGVWLEAAARRPEQRPRARRARRVPRVPATPFAAAAVCAARRYGRRRELLRSAGGLTALAAGTGIAASTWLDGSAAAPAVALAALGVAVVPLAAPGLDRESSWLWRTAPYPPRRGGVASGAAALALALALAASAAAAVAAAEAPTGPELAQVAWLAALVWAAATAAGAVAPWRGDRLGDQLGTIAVFAAVATVVVAGAGAAVERAPGAGVPQPAAVGATAALALVLAVALRAHLAARS